MFASAAERELNRRLDSGEDPQQQKVYTWEGTWTDFNRPTLSVRACRKLVAQACRWYGVKAPTVFPAPVKARWAYYHTEKHHICLNRPSQNIAIVLHESAHAIVSRLSPRATDHGPTWLGVYLDLLTGFYPRTALQASARALGLRWDNRLVSIRHKKSRPKAAKKRK